MKDERFDVEYYKNNFDLYNTEYNYFLRFASKKTLEKFNVKTCGGGEFENCPIIKLNEKSFLIRNLIYKNRPKYLFQGNVSNQSFFSINNFVDENKPVIVCEGLSFFLWLADNNYNALCLLGTQFNTRMYEILKQFKSDIYIIPDDDNAGRCCRNRFKGLFKNAKERFLKENSIEKFIEVAGDLK